MKPEEQVLPTESSSQETARKSLFSTHWETTGEAQEVENYSQWSILAILSLILGVASLTAFLYYGCLFLAVLGIPITIVAYLRIQWSDGALLGSFAALIGLFFSVLTLVGVSVMWPYYEYTVRSEADRFFRIWFEAVKEKDIRRVVEMKNPTWSRKLDTDMNEWWKSKLDHKGEMAEEIISTFLSTINNLEMRTLWALGEKEQAKMEISYYQTTLNRYYDGKDTVTSLYAVTFTSPDQPEQSSDRKTFFIQITGERTKNHNDKTQLGWALSGFPTILKEIPEELKK